MTDVSPKTTRRRESPDVRREQVLEAAERVLMERGLPGTTVADIADAAAVAKGTVYLYFKSKAEILAGLRERYVSRASAQIRSAVESRRDSPSQLDAFVAEFFAVSLDTQELHHLLFHEAGFSEGDALAEARVVLVELLARGVAAGEFHVDDMDVTADFVIAGVHGALVAFMHARDRRPKKYVASVQALARRSVGVAQ